MPGKLVLDSLEIRNFRGLRELKIERLGRVNLIVGKNNVGKTSLLEALRLYARPASGDVLLRILDERDELDWYVGLDRERRTRYPVPYEGLFSEWTGGTEQLGAIEIGPIQVPERSLTIWPEPWPDHVYPHHRYKTALVFQAGAEGYLLPMDDVLETYQYARMLDSQLSAWHKGELPIIYVGPGGIRGGILDEIWESITLTPSKALILEILRIIAKGVEEVDFKRPNSLSRTRYPFVKVEGRSRPVPLKTLGDGTSRLFGIGLALVNSAGGLFLVDEFENGVHYSIQTEFWKMVFRVSAQLNVQIFATTHSYDCIRAFGEAARESEEEGFLIRLARKNDRSFVAEFDEEEMGIAIEERMEVR